MNPGPELERTRSRERRIGVLGAGAAGISAAAYLSDAGYKNVVILEKSNVAGGKCHSLKACGHTWELGAVLGTVDYKETLGLMRRVGLEIHDAVTPFHQGNEEEVDSSLLRLGFWPMERSGQWLGAAELAKAVAEMGRYRTLSRQIDHAGGHAEVHPDFGLSFEEWARAHGISSLAKMFSIPFTAYGYGQYKDVPAAYVIKYFEPGFVDSLVFRKDFFTWTHGVQSLWERIAREMKVLYGAQVVSISRPAHDDGDPVVIRLADGSVLEFDRLIVACPIDEAWALMNPEPEEIRLAASIQHNDYFVSICKIEGLPIASGFVPQRFGEDGIGSPVFWLQRHRNTDIYTFYSMGNRSQNPTEIEAAIASDVQRMGGRLHETLAAARWKYFPHVTPEVYRSGYYPRLESLQGRRSTYLAGELMNFSTVECTVRYSKNLVSRFFS